MQMKMSLVTMVILAGMLSQSGASDVTPLQADSVIPGFSFVQQISLLRKLFMSSLTGNILNFQKILNMSDWQSIITPNSTTVLQKVAFPNMKASWNDTKATLGLLRSTGIMDANLGGSTFDLIMTATGNNDTCNLNITVLLDKLEVIPDMSQMGLIGTVIGTLMSVVTGLTSTLTGLLTGVLGLVLTLLVGQEMASMLDLDALCKQMINGNMTNLPDLPSL